MESASGGNSKLQKRAEAELHKRQDFAIHVAAYLSVNVLLVALWSFAGGGEFWPIVPIVVWGMALALHGWTVFGRLASEDPLAREMDRLRAKGAGR
jgi:2TM domain